MSALRDILLRQISVTGPMSMADYMAACLLHPEHGYYTQARVFGAEGDFVTAPEISQMFGELIGLALAQSWLDQGTPQRFVLAEAGPGRGTLMADLLRASRRVPGFLASSQLHLVEASARLRDRQRGALGDHPVQWHDRLEDLPQSPLFFVANEFLDALPVRQFERSGDWWRERIVVAEDGCLCPRLAAPRPEVALAGRLADTEPGDVVEFCPGLPTVVDAVASRIARHGGVAIFVDYGDWRSRGDTLQAVRDHRPVDPFESPGRADLTAHVDFEAIAQAATDAGAAVSAMIPQGVWLERLGITQRAQALAASITDLAALENHVAAHRRLTHPEEMGSLFKAIAIYPNGAPIPPGFES